MASASGYPGASAEDGSESPLMHQVALMGDKEIRAPVLESRCRKNSRDPEALEVAEASSRGLLTCAVCGSPLRQKFGPSNRWHFALIPSSAPCDHENESVAHRDAKLALFKALRATLPAGWRVFLEKGLPMGRRPDVLAVHDAGGRVAFEVQYADLPEKAWRERHEAYATAGIRDHWLLGHRRREMARDTLASVLAGEEGQRMIYVGRWEDVPEPRGVAAREALFPDPGGSGLLLPGAAVSREARARRGAGYGLRALSLSEDGSLTTPADTLHERLERERVEEERRQRAREEARRKAAQMDLQRGKEKQRWVAEKKAEEARAWFASPERTWALSLLGQKRLSRLEEAGGLDKNIHAHPGRWKSEIFLSCVHGRPPGAVFDWFGAAYGVLGRHGHNKRERGSWAWKALWSFLEGLERAGLVEFHEPDGRGKSRYWRTTSEDTLARRREEKKRGRAETRLRADERAALEAKWETTRQERLERERWEAIRLGAWSVPEGDAARKARVSRAERALSWLSSPDRSATRKLVGDRTMVLLEREAPEDRVILTHPGEWKSMVFLLFVHGTTGETLDEGVVAQKVYEEFRETPAGSAVEGTSPTKVAMRLAVQRFLGTLQGEGLLRERVAREPEQKETGSAEAEPKGG